MFVLMKTQCEELYIEKQPFLLSQGHGVVGIHALRVN